MKNVLPYRNRGLVVLEGDFKVNMFVNAISFSRGLVLSIIVQWDEFCKDILGFLKKEKKEECIYL